MSVNNSNKPIKKSKIGYQVKEWLPAVVAFISVILIWQIAVIQLEIPRYILPQPTSIAEMATTRASNLLTHLGWTLYEAFGGFLIGSGLAFLSAVLFTHVRVVERGLYPWAVVLQTVPIVAIAPLLTIWMGFGAASKMMISAIICFFPMLVNAQRGLRAVSPQALELMRILSASKWDILIRLRLPSSLPYLFAGLKVTSTLSIVGAIVGEFTGADYGIGKIILVSSYTQNTTQLFAGLIYSSLAAIIFFILIVYLEKIVLRWQVSA